MRPPKPWLIAAAIVAAQPGAVAAASIEERVAALLAKIEQVSADIVPGADRPLDLRGYRFPGDFHERYPGFPRTSYDLAFGSPETIDAFVRDRIADWRERSAVEIFEGTRVSIYGSDPAITVTQHGRSSTSVFIPLPDGGHARIDYDHATAKVTLHDVYDSQGLSLPPGNGNFKRHFARYPTLNFAEGARGQAGLQHLHEWAARNGIPMLRGEPWLAGAFTTCVAGFERSAMSLTCRMPRQAAPLNGRAIPPTP